MIEYRDIKGYEGKYQVSNKGDVISLNFNRSGEAKTLKPGKSHNGYYSVKLSKNNELRSYRINRLVAEAFIPNPDNKPTVNHINHDITDNSVENLEWATHIEQCDQKWREHLHILNKAWCSKEVRCIETGIIYKSAMEAQRCTGVNQGNLIQHLKGKYKTCGGFHWEYTRKERG